MVLGVGVDVLDVGRMERAVARRGRGFVDAFLNPSEVSRLAPHFAGTCAAAFAAKEAFFKALGTGRSGRLSWKDVEVAQDSREGPRMTLKGPARQAAAARGVKRIHLDLVHEAGRTAAVVVLEGDPRGVRG